MGRAENRADMSANQVIEVVGRGVGSASELFVKLATTNGFTVVAAGPNRFLLARTYRPTWAKVAAGATAIFAGLGLFFLLVKRTETGDAVIAEDRTGVKVRLAGTLPVAFIDSLRSELGAARLPAQALTTSQFAPATRQGPASAAQPPAPPRPPAPPSPGFSPSPGAFGGNPDLTIQRHSTVAPAAPSSPAQFAPAQFAPSPPAPAYPAAAAYPAAPPPPPSPPSPPAPGATLVLPDGRNIPVGAGGVIGRDPSPIAAAPNLPLHLIGDASLSKTHLAFGPLPHGVWLIDQHSTNGTVVVAGGVSAPCTPGQRAEAPFGALVIAGDLNMMVGRS